jgi:hypothetical protein
MIGWVKVGSGGDVIPRDSVAVPVNRPLRWSYVKVASSVGKKEHVALLRSQTCGFIQFAILIE